MKSRSIQITERDLKLLREINRFGYTDIHYISEHFKWHQKLAYRRLLKLTQHGFLQHQQLLYGFPGVYWCTKLGTEISNDTLSTIRKINLNTFSHQLKALHLSLSLTKEHKGKFTTEREIRQSLGFAAIKSNLHIPDGMLEINNKKIAIEVELTVKSQRRLEKILRHYQRDFSYDQVWYYCGTQEVKNKIDRLNKNKTLVITKLIKDR